MWRQIFFLLSIGLVFSARISDRVINLPGLPDTPNFAMYSGYLNIPNSNGKSLHYVLVESQNDPSTDPLILWLNGGPGCSSMDGLFYEHGPYIFPPDSNVLVRNQYAWNTNASVIYLEAPAGVGFSVMGDSSNNQTNDEITAHDNVQALLQFFQGFPEYRHNDFYISGESYAGIYVPTFAYNVLMHNLYSPYDDINLVGIMVGNGCTDWTVDTNPAFMKMAYSHVLVAGDIGQQLVNACDNFNEFNNYDCQNVTDEINYVLFNNLNIYDLYGTCYYHPNSQYDSFNDNQGKLRFLKDSGKLGLIPPCGAWYGIYSYLKNPAVRQALNIPTTVQQWELCNNIDYTSDYLHGSLYTYNYIIRSKIRVLIYSGDTDGAVPTIGTREWINKLNLGYQKMYTQWYVNDQVAGFYENYNGLTLVTVKGAGHMVPQFKPPQAHHMLLAFLTNQDP